MTKNFFAKKAKYLLFPLIAFSSFLILHSHLKKVTDEPTMTLAPWALSVAKVTTGRVTEGFPALGEVESASEVRISPQISGRILDLGPRAGGHVEKGDLLVQIDTEELEENRDALQAKRVSAKVSLQHDQRELQREQKLFKEGGSAVSAVDQWQTKVREDRANVLSLQKQINQIQVKIGYGHIVSPLDAGVAQRLVEMGDTAIPGKILYVLTSKQGGRVIVPIPLETLTHVKPGGEVKISRDKAMLTAHITRINPALDKMAMGSVEIDLPQRVFNLPDGSPVAVRVISKIIEQSLIVPHSALVPSSETHIGHIFKVKHSATGDKLSKITVNIALCGIEGCAISGDIQASDQVVIGHGSVLLRLRDKDSIRAMTTDEATR